MASLASLLTISILLGTHELLQPLANWVCWSLGGVWWRDWLSPLCWPWAKTLILRDSWETLLQTMLAPREVARPSREVEPLALSKNVLASLWEVFKETWNWVLLETLGLMEPDERSCSNFSRSNSTTSDSSIDPRSLRSVCATAFSLVEKTIPQRSRHLLFPLKNWKRVKSIRL